MVYYRCTLLHILTSCIVNAASDFAAAPSGRKLMSIISMAFSIFSSFISSESTSPCSNILGTYFSQFSAIYCVASSPHIKQNSASTYKSMYIKTATTIITASDVLSFKSCGYVELRHSHITL